MNRLLVFCMFILTALQTVASDVCNAWADSCGACLNNHQPPQVNCGWCPDRDFEGPRCVSIGSLNQRRCRSPERIYFRVQPVQDLTLTRTQRIKPQAMELRMKTHRQQVWEVPFQIKSTKQWVATRLSYPRDKYNIIMTSQCRFRFRSTTGRGRCSGTRPGQVIDYKLRISTLDCNADGRITIKIRGDTQSKLIIRVFSDCACGCEAQQDRFSPVCHNKGHLTCGACQCEEEFFGRNCECDATGGSSESCKSGPDELICSGQGECVCGQCECFPVHQSTLMMYSGRYCECNDFSCLYHNGAICGGETRGRCQCGQCICKDGYAGDSCGVSTSTDGCMAFNGEVCNGKGLCMSGQCLCEYGYVGRTCEDCSTCPGRCSVLKSCVQCSVFRSGELTEEQCYNQCRLYGIQTVQTLNTEGHRCAFRDTDGCRFHFMYMFDSDGELVVKAQRTKECPRPGK